MSFFTGLWPLVRHFTEGSLLVAGLAAAAWFSPVFKKDFAWAAALVACVLFAYTVGVRDEKVRRDDQEKDLIHQVHLATLNAIVNGTPDPYDESDN